MKIIFFGGIRKLNTNELSIEDITGSPALYSYFLRKEFDKLGIETSYCPATSREATDEELNNIQIPKGNHILSVFQRAFSIRCRPTNNLLNNIRSSISGKMTAICDHHVNHPVEDIIFYSIPINKIPDKNIYLGWACDHSLLTPQKEIDTIRILIDHAYYGKSQPLDMTVSISKQCLDFQKEYKDKKVIIRRFSGLNGCETIDENNWNDGNYNRGTSMPYPKACEEYKRADIFIVTHPESMGLSVLESAAAGAYILAPDNYIKPAILKNIRHDTFSNKLVPFNEAIQKLNINESIKQTKDFTWNNITNKILETL